MSIHSRNDQIVLEFGLKKPAFRIVVNTPTTHGSIGLTTGLDPAMTLGCGGWGGNITSDNISPKHLLNVKRVAYETTPALTTAPRPASVSSTSVTPAKKSSGLTPDVLSDRIDQFLASKGIATSPPSSVPRATVTQAPDFVCEDDVKQALKAGQKIVLSSRTIVTPAARDLGEEKRIFIESR